MEQNGSIVILGLGGGGGRIADRAAAGLTFTGLVAVAADTDETALAALNLERRIALGREWSRGEGCGGDMVLGERAASASAEELRELIDGARLLFVAVGLGGGTGSGAARVLARLARECGTPTVFLATLPFSFEGNWKRTEAENCLSPLRDMTDAVIAIPNDLLFTQLPADTPAGEAFAMADRLLADGLTGLARITSTQGLVSADIASLRTLLKDRPAGCILAVGTADASEGWECALERLVNSPFVAGGEALTQADAAVLTLLGGMDLSLGQVQACLQTFQSRLPQRARTVVGAYADPQLEDRIQLTALVCRYQDDEAATATVTEATRRGRSPARRTPSRRKKAPDPAKQGLLPLQEQTLGIFTGAQPTTVNGENLDIPTFQRKGVQPDIGT